MTQVPYHFYLEDKTMIEKMFKSLMEKHEMNHIEYKIFNSIQDPANKKTEEHYTNLQGKVADAVSDDQRVKMVLTWCCEGFWSSHICYDDLHHPLLSWLCSTGKQENCWENPGIEYLLWEIV